MIKIFPTVQEVLPFSQTTDGWTNLSIIGHTPKADLIVDRSTFLWDMTINRRKKKNKIDLTLIMLGKIGENDILKYFPIFARKNRL